MKSLLRSYYYRLFRSKGFYVEIGILFGLSLLIGLILIWTKAIDDIGKDTLVLSAWTGGSFLGSIPWFPLTLFAFTGAINYHREVSSGALRNYIISGHSRKEIYVGLYIGYLSTYLLLQVATFLGLGSLGLIFGAAPGDAFDGQSFALCMVFCTYCDIALFTFFYFLFVVMKGHGFSGPLGIIIYSGLAGIMTIVMLIGTVMVSNDNISQESFNIFCYVDTWVFPSLRSHLAGGNIAAMPRVMPFLGGDSALDATANNIAASIVLPTLIGFGSFFLGLFRFDRYDFK